MKKIFTFWLLLLTLATTWQVKAAEITGASIGVTLNGIPMSITLEASGMNMIDLTQDEDGEERIISSFVLNSFLAQTTGDLLNLKLSCAEIYEVGGGAYNWNIFSATNESMGAWWANDINHNVSYPIVPGTTYVMEFYLSGNDAQDNTVFYNNDGQNYKIKFKYDVEPEEIEWHPDIAAMVQLVRNGELYSLAYRGDGSIATGDVQLGTVRTLSLEATALLFKKQPDVGIISSQMYIRIDSADRAIERFFFDLEEMEHAGIYTKYGAEDMHDNIIANLPNGSYSMQVVYDIVTSSDSYYSLGWDNDNFKLHFTVDKPANDPLFMGIKEVRVWSTYTEDEEPSANFIPKFNFPAIIDMSDDDGQQVYHNVFKVGRFTAQTADGVHSVKMKVSTYELGSSAQTWIQFDATNQGGQTWTTDNMNYNVFANCELGHQYIVEFYFEGIDADGNTVYYNNGGINYKLKFHYDIPLTGLFVRGGDTQGQALREWNMTKIGEEIYELNLVERNLTLSSSFRITDAYLDEVWLGAPNLEAPAPIKGVPYDIYNTYIPIPCPTDFSVGRIVLNKVAGNIILYDRTNVGIGYVLSPQGTLEKIYDLSGRQLNARKKGVNIIKLRDGTTKKVLVR